MKKFLIWTFAVILTLSAAVYQRKTGPTNPKYFEVKINNNQYRIKLERTHITTKDAIVSLPVEDTTVKASLHYRIFPSDAPFTRVEFVQDGSVKKAVLPPMPPAGKVEYYVTLETNDDNVTLGKDTPVITRFRNDVPAYILIPHIFFMFFAMLFSSATGLFVLFKKGNYKALMNITIVILFIGGLILGPLVQKFAFGEFWTGFPFGRDLTDNKTLIAFIFWIAAFLLNIKKKRSVAVITASIILLLIFTIPHSMWGSQLNTETGKISTGKQ